MAVGFRNAAGVDFDSLFDPYVMGTPVGSVGFRTSGGVDIGPRYAPISFGTKGPDVGFRTSGGVDVSNFWAAFGTASYASSGGVPGLVRDDIVVSPSGGTANAFIQYFQNGTVQWSDNTGGVETGTWAPGGGTPGDAYDIKYQVISGDGGPGFLSGADNIWRQINTGRSVGLSIFGSGGGFVSAERGVNVQIRRRSDNVVVVSYNTTLGASVTSDG